MTCITSNSFNKLSVLQQGSANYIQPAGFGPLPEIRFYGTQLCPFVYVLYIVAFAPQWQSWVVETRTISPQSLICLLSESLKKVCQPLYYSTDSVGEVGIETGQNQLCFFRRTTLPATPPTQPGGPSHTQTLLSHYS